MAARARTAMVGQYAFDLAAYTPRTIVPRIRQHGTWVESGTFTHTIVDTDDFAALVEIINTTDAWHKRYSAYARTMPRSGLIPCAERQRQDMLRAAVSIAFNINGDAHGGTSDGTVFVVVRHGGVIVSIQQGRRGTERDGDSDTMRIIDSLSAPDNVITPDAEGALRGAGAYALQQLLEYSRAHGLQRVTSTAITEPSALVKVDAGFYRTGNIRE